MRNNRLSGNDLFHDVPPRGFLARWLPILVTVGTLGGFVSLAWYAYHTGSQPAGENDLTVVEADKTPMKEKPLDPGGMKFPNQDKTVFETFSNNSQNPPKVERVMPPPEEPMAVDEAQTKTFVNEKFKNPQASKSTDEKTEKKPSIVTEKPAGAAKGDTASAVAANIKADKNLVIPSGVDRAAKKTDDDIKTYTADSQAAEKTPVPEAVKPIAKIDTKEKKLAAPIFAPVSATGAKIQLGAYRSENEAQEAWTKMQKKHGELSGKSQSIVKADLGDKGVYYRLRAGGFSDSAAAKKICEGLEHKGQPCIIAKP